MTELIEGMPEAEYHSLERMSASRLKVLERGTPRHLTAMLAEDRNTPAMRIGSAMHCLALLGDDAFKRQFCISPEGDKRTTKVKEAWAAFEPTIGGRTVLTVGEYEDARNMADSLLTDPQSYDIIRSCSMREVTALGEVDGIPTKARLDLYQPGSILSDIKSIGEDASPRNCNAYAIKWGVWLQMALYRRMGVSLHGASILFVESKPPYCVAVRRMDAPILDQYDSELNRCIIRYRRWMESPNDGWTDGTPLSLPSWKAYELENSPYQENA